MASYEDKEKLKTGDFGDFGSTLTYRGKTGTVYIYIYSVKDLGQQRKNKKFASIVLALDGKRSEKGELSDIDLVRSSCQYLRNQKVPEIREENKHPRAPEIAQECKAYSKWYSCHYSHIRGFPLYPVSTSWTGSGLLLR